MAGAAVSMLVLVAGCGGEATTGEPTSADTTSSSSSPRPTTSKTTTTVQRAPETDTAAAEAPAAANPAVAGPTLIECIYGGGAWTGSGRLSDGSFGLHPRCEALRSEQLAQYPYVCPQTDHHVADLSECANPNSVPVVPEVQDPPKVDKPEETEDAGEPTVDPPVEPGTDEESEDDPCEPGDTSEACQE